MKYLEWSPEYILTTAKGGKSSGKDGKSGGKDVKGGKGGGKGPQKPTDDPDFVRWSKNMRLEGSSTGARSGGEVQTG